jgi:hypothetical protein
MLAHHFLLYVVHTFFDTGQKQPEENIQKQNKS